MPPKVKFQKEEIVNVAFEITREKGIDAVTAREVASALHVSTRPIFTWFDTMEHLKAEVFEKAKDRYRAYIECGLQEQIPFLGIWQQYIRFAKEERALYKLLFLSKPNGTIGRAADALALSQELARESLMRIYRIDAYSADCYFRDLWLVAYSFGTLIVTDDCPYSDDEIFAIGAEISLSICKAYKEIPGLAKGAYDRDAIFLNLTAEKGFDAS